jgi:hypothetical protein
MLLMDSVQNGYEAEVDSMIEAPAYGLGLQVWLKNSPEFNADKIMAPLQVVAKRGMNIIFMWEPYAALRLLKKPVDLTVLNTTEHVLSNPGIRLASQGGTVD